MKKIIMTFILALLMMTSFIYADDMIDELDDFGNWTDTGGWKANGHLYVKDNSSNWINCKYDFNQPPYNSNAYEFEFKTYDNYQNYRQYKIHVGDMVIYKDYKMFKFENVGANASPFEIGGVLFSDSENINIKIRLSRDEENYFTGSIAICQEDGSMVIKKIDRRTFPHLRIKLESDNFWSVTAKKKYYFDYVRMYSLDNRPEIQSIKQDGDQLIIQFKNNNGAFNIVHIDYNKNGSSSNLGMKPIGVGDNTVVIHDIKNLNLNGGKIELQLSGCEGIIGQKVSENFEYIEPVADFKYTRLNDNRIKFTWTDNGNNYLIKDGNNVSSEFIPTANNSAIAPLYYANIPNTQIEESVVIYATNSYGRSIPTKAVIGNSESIANFKSEVLNYKVKFTWDKYVKAGSTITYKLYRRRLGETLGSVISSGITNEEVIVDMPTSDVVNEYYVKAFANGVEESGSQSGVVAVSNKVTNFKVDRVDDLLNIHWDALGTGSQYVLKFYKDENLTMYDGEQIVNTLSYDYIPADNSDRWVTIMAKDISSNASLVSDALKLDNSWKVMVSNLNGYYMQDSNTLYLIWDPYPSATGYKIYFADGTETIINANEYYDSTNNKIIFPYILKKADPNIINMKVTVSTADIVESAKKECAVPTYSMTKVQSLSVAKYKAGSQNKLMFSWEKLFRSDSYKIVVKKAGTVIDTQTVQADVFEYHMDDSGDEVEFFIKGLYGTVESLENSISSNQANNEVDIILDGDDYSIDGKLYQSALNLKYKILVNEKISEPRVKLVLDYPKKNGNVIAEYIYPKLEKFDGIDTSNEKLLSSVNDYDDAFEIVTDLEKIGTDFKKYPANTEFNIEFLTDVSFDVIKDSSDPLQRTILDDLLQAGSVTYVNDAGNTVTENLPKISDMELPFTIEQRLLRESLANNFVVYLYFSYHDAGGVLKTKTHRLEFKLNNKINDLGDYGN